MLLIFATISYIALIRDFKICNEAGPWKNSRKTAQTLPNSVARRNLSTYNEIDDLLLCLNK